MIFLRRISTSTNKEIAFQKECGWKNPHNHLKSCICHGHIEELQKYMQNF